PYDVRVARPPSPPPFPYTTLFRAGGVAPPAAELAHIGRRGLWCQVQPGQGQGGQAEVGRHALDRAGSGIWGERPSGDEVGGGLRSEERRVGKAWRSRWATSR